MSQQSVLERPEQSNGQVTEAGVNALLESAPVEAVGPDPFNVEALRLPENYSAIVGVRKAILSIPKRKPANSWFVRVHPDEAYRLMTAVIEIKEDREVYLVDRALWPELSTEATFSPRILFAAINRQGVLFIWPVRLPGATGRIDEWSKTALEAAQTATKRWVRIAANMSLGAYDMFEANESLSEPEWPELTFSEILRIAFKDAFINDFSHPVLRKLRGEV